MRTRTKDRNQLSEAGAILLIAAIVLASLLAAHIAARAAAWAAEASKASDPRLLEACAPRVLVAWPGSIVYEPNPATGCPAWVGQHLTADNLRGAADRAGLGFTADPLADPRWRARDAWYDGSGFDRGHGATAELHKRSAGELASTFNLGLVFPQNPTLNRAGAWRKIEQQIKGLLDARHEAIVVTAPAFDYRHERPRSIGDGHLLVPTHLAAAVLVLADGEPKRMLAWLVPNRAEAADAEKYRVSVDALEDQWLARDLFAWLPDEIEARLERARVESP